MERLKDRLAFLLHQRSGLVLAYRRALKAIIAVGMPPPELSEAGLFDPDVQANSDP